LHEISRLRLRIDEIDHHLVKLLNARFENAQKLGRIKKSEGLAYRDLERESEILSNVRQLAIEMERDPELLGPVFQQIFKMSVKAQKNFSKKHGLHLRRQNVLVVGGTGGMGSFFARFARDHGAEVTIAGRSRRRTQTVARELDVGSGSMNDASTSDIVIVAVPIEATRKVALEVASRMRNGSLLSDLSSVKTGISDVIANRVVDSLEYVSLHPLFGPDVDDMHGQNVAVIPYRKGPKWAKLSKAMESAGARIRASTVESHDRAMAYVQGLHHYALICLGISLTEWNGSLNTSSLRATQGRITTLVSAWDTIMGIQLANPFVPPLRRKFASTVGEILDLPSSKAEWVRKTLRENVQKWSRKQ